MKIKEFEKGDIIVKVSPSVIIENIRDGMFSMKKQQVESRTYMNCIFRLQGIGNNFAYLETLSDIHNNKIFISKICIDEYGEGWEKLVISKGLTLDQILNK